MQQRALANDIIGNMATRIQKDHEFRYWIAKELPNMRGNGRSVVLAAIEASGVSDSRLSFAIQKPVLEGIMKEPVKLRLVQ